jgi:hypothetical protein
MTCHGFSSLRQGRLIGVVLLGLSGAFGLAGCGGTQPRAASESSTPAPDAKATKPQTVRTARGKVTLEPDISIRDRLKQRQEGKRP